MGVAYVHTLVFKEAVQDGQILFSSPTAESERLHCELQRHSFFTALVNVGDVIWVKCIGIDDKGRIKLSRRAAMKDRNEAAGAEIAQPANA